MADLDTRDQARADHETLAPDRVANYLERTGWARASQDDRVSTWRLGNDLQVVLPLRRTADTPQLLYEAIRVIAFVEQRAEREVSVDIEYGGADVVSVRLTPNAPSGQAPLPVAEAAIAALRLLVVGSAGAEGDVSLAGSRRKRAARYASQVRLSTSSGSFVVTLALPLHEGTAAPPMLNTQLTMDQIIDIEAPPFGRDVSNRIRRVSAAAASLARTIQTGEEDLTAFEADPRRSGTAPELEALASLGGKATISYQLRVAASPLMPVAGETAETIEVSGATKHVLSEAAALLRSRRPRADVTVIGTVVQLTRDGTVGPGEIVLRGVEVGGRSAHRYRVFLGEDDYSEALKAHELGLWVSAGGALELHGNYLIMSEPVEFYVQQPLPGNA